MEDVKQVIVIRNDLNMRKGKMVAQGAHASCSFMSFKLQSGQKLTKEEEQWLHGSFAKVCVQCDSEEQLMEIYQQAKDDMLTVHLITDSGRTEFNGVPTKTCLAIGPHAKGKIDKITGSLKLL
jgi:PTH2 family peptidyl-tRNA hydrolase